MAVVLPAQTLRGRALLPDSTTGVPGAVVVVLDTGGVAVGQTTTAAQGNFSLALPRAGTFELRVLRIGFRQTIRKDISVRAGESRVVDVVVNVDGFSLDTVTISAKTRCGANRLSDPRLAAMWTAARTALLAVSREQYAPTLDIRAVVYSGTTDTTDSVRLVEDASLLRVRDARLFVARSADSLAARGYVQRHPDSSMSYALPDAGVVLSNTFVAMHCFGIAGAAPGHPDWVGIAFEPMRDRPGVRDVQGAIWLERFPLTLRRIAFRYTLPGRFLDEGTGGGFVDFVKVSSGQWLAARWMVRADAAWIQPGSIRRTDLFRDWRETRPGFFTNRRLVYDYRAMIGASAAVVFSGGVEVFRDDTALAIVPAHLEGFVRDSAGRSIKGAQIRAAGSVAAATSDDSGFFRLTGLHARETTFAVTRPGFAALSIRVRLRPDSTVHVEVVLVPPPRRRLRLARGCAKPLTGKQGRSTRSASAMNDNDHC